MNAIFLALKYLPLVLQTVLAIEAAYKEQKQAGATKKAIVLDAVTAAAGVAKGADNDDVKVIGKLIDSIVGTLNALGWVK